MKIKYKIILLFFCGFSITLFSQNAPEGEWREEYWPWEHEVWQTTPTNGDQWFNGHDLRYDQENNTIGYVAVGYSSYIRYDHNLEEFIFHDETKLDNPGCFKQSVQEESCVDFVGPKNPKGTFYPHIALIDQKGNVINEKVLYTKGEYYNVKQTTDGGYIAVGIAGGTRLFPDIHLQNPEPIIYNPGRNGISNYFRANNGECSSSHKKKGLITKFDHDLNIEWNYLYGLVKFEENDPLASSKEAELIDILELDDGSFMAVGVTEFTEYCRARGFVLKIDENGHWTWGDFYSKSKADFTRLNAVTSYVIDGVEKIVIGGEITPYEYGTCITKKYEEPLIFQIPNTNTAPNIDWQTIPDLTNHCGQFFSNHTGIALSDITISNQNTILVPIVKSNLPFGILGDNGSRGVCTGSVYEFDLTNGALLCPTFIIPKLLQAFDMKMGITNTQDGGFAIVTSRKRQKGENGYISAIPNGFCEEKFFQDYFFTDAYIVKYTAERDVEWEKTFDSNSIRPPLSLFSGWSYPDNPHYRDVKLQECLYTITEDDDGQFAIAGNTSSNIDDSYMARVCNLDQKNVFLPINDIIIDDETRRYIANVYLLAGGVEIKNNSNVEFVAGNQIEITPNVPGSSNRTFHVKSGTVFHAYIDNTLGCFPSENSGSFKTNEKDEYVIKYNHETEIIFNIYPNPTKDKINILYNSNQLGVLNLNLYSLMGEKVLSENIDFDGSQVLLNIQSLTKGAYILSITSERGISENFKIIKE